jgi:DNA invertase Pin-like site-specific DNA recombinase
MLPSSRETKPTSPRQAWGYVRVSTEGQAAEGVSIAMQRARIEAHCFAAGIELAGVLVDEGASGKTLDRPQFTALLEKVRAGEVSHLVVYKLDRLTRRTRDLLALVEDELKPRGVALVSLSEAIDTASPAGVMVLTMLGALAQMERELIAERTRAALAHKRTRGDRLGTTPLGFSTPEAGAAMVPVAAELEPVRVIVSRRQAGATYRAIAAELTAAAYPTKRGGQWDGATVRKVWMGRARYGAHLAETRAVGAVA